VGIRAELGQPGLGMAAVRVNAALIWSAQGQLDRCVASGDVAADEAGAGVQEVVAESFWLGQSDGRGSNRCRTRCATSLRKSSPRKSRDS
jgi:hypothetical protein